MHPDLRGGMDADVWEILAYRLQEAEVLDDDRIDPGSPCFVDQAQSILQLLVE